MQCDEIQEVLLEYLTREMGPARAALVREHLRRCPACKSAAAALQATLHALHRDAEEGGGPVRLSEDRRARLFRAFAHPVLDWGYRHHIIVSLIVAVVVTLLVWLRIRTMQAWNPPLTGGIPVNIQDAPRTPGQKPPPTEGAPQHAPPPAHTTP
jgi:predicted anti-sigma-YlaC factor YlaD